ncbi:hypothetical protein [Sphaerisporangium sp. NPDC051011]|uniref:hypothetical protein n=1 Tax=Sphaerisporangium sp. NPDC051011 TaxID=3155792 RepID=UPI0033CE232B
MGNDKHTRKLLVSSDTADYGSRSDKIREELQVGFIATHDRAAAATGLHRDGWERHPAGDGELVVLPPTEPESAVVDGYVRRLAAELGERNAGLPVDEKLRLRVAVHFGVVYPAPNGLGGHAVVQVSRLLDWKPLKRALKEAPEMNLVLIVSNRVFDETIRQGHTSHEIDTFLRVAVHEKEFQGEAWVWSPDVDVRRLAALTDPKAGEEAGEKTAPSVAQNASVINNFNERIRLNKANFGVIN